MQFTEISFNTLGIIKVTILKILVNKYYYYYYLTLLPNGYSTHCNVSWPEPINVVI